jgi:hypothetical protein
MKNLDGSGRALRRLWRWLAMAVLAPALAYGAYRAFHKTKGHAEPEETFVPRPLQPAPRCEQRTGPGLAPRPVCIAPWKDDRCIICNYKIVQEVDLRSGATKTLTPDARVAVWEPTGVCAREREGLVFVANYNGHDVLEMRRVKDCLELVRHYTHPEMRSPENVAVSADGLLVGVADYDGDRLLVFRRDGSLAWSHPAGQAHGVAFGPDFVVVSSLRDRLMRKLDLSGNLLCQAGAPGWGDNRYLWPTCVAFHAGRVHVSDAHTGKISVLDDALHTLDWFGGNGPGAGLLNMPYGIAGGAGRLLVCDTFGDRVLELDNDSRCTRILARRTQPLPWEGGPAAGGVTRRGYTETTPSCRVATPAAVQGAWHASYFGYTTSGARHTRYLRFPSFGSLFNEEIYPYFCWCQTAVVADRSFLLLGHSQGTHVLVMDELGRCRVVDARECLWQRDGILYTSAGAALDPVRLVAEALRAFAEHDRLRQLGVDYVDALQRAYWPALSRADFMGRLESSFTTEPGRAFWTRWRQAGSPDDRQAAARDFDAAVARERTVCLQEIFLRHMLTGPD